jgi:hypothetical protein
VLSASSTPKGGAWPAWTSTLMKERIPCSWSTGGTSKRCSAAASSVITGRRAMKL